MLTENLFPLLQQCQSFSPEYHNGLSLHLPMALIALAKIGGQEQHLQEYFKNHTEQQVAAPACPLEITADNFLSHLGQLDAYSGYQQFFLQQITRKGKSASLRHFLPQLMPGMGTSAFHALIRLGYALDLDASQENPPAATAQIINTEFACALATLASLYHFLPTAAIGSQTKQANVSDIIPTLCSANWKNWESKKTLISARVSSVASLPDFPEVIHLLQIDPQQVDTCLQSLSDYAAQLYLQEKNFTVLHMLTASHAMRLALPYFKDQVAALRYFWQAYAAAFIASQANMLNPTSSLVKTSNLESTPDWQQLLQSVLTHQNDHVIKLMYSCCEQYHAYRQPVYWLLAAQLHS